MTPVLVKARGIYNLAGGFSAYGPVSQTCDFKSFPTLLFLFMDLIDKLTDYEVWHSFLEYKRNTGRLSKSEEKELTDFIENKSYTDSAVYFQNGGAFSVPEAVQVNKSFSDKKRTVFRFRADEKLIQKLIAYLLLDYDSIFCDNLYSFRPDTGVKRAFKSLAYHKGISGMYSYKLDISDYFNSVNADILLPILKDVLKSEERLYSLIRNMLLNPYAIVEGEQREIRKGILAGSPLSGFLANLYLTELDKYFYDTGVLYARYSDDIIVFADTNDELASYVKIINGYLEKYRLKINVDKVCYTMPHCKWTFLGFSFSDGKVDISEISKMKLKKKMKRKARALLRWRIKKKASPERAVRAYIRHFNKKLYSNPVNYEITWCRWYFPVINTSESLKELDMYMQQCIRYVATGTFNKSGYSFKYEDMKALGYATLVNRYYAFKNDGEIFK